MGARDSREDGILTMNWKNPVFIDPEVERKDRARKAFSDSLLEAGEGPLRITRGLNKALDEVTCVTVDDALVGEALRAGNMHETDRTRMVRALKAAFIEAGFRVVA